MNKTNKYLILLLAVGLFSQRANAQVKVGDNPTSIDNSAVLEMESTTKGLLMPRMTTAERDLIATPAVGLMIFNTTTNQVEFNSGTTIAPIWSSANASNAWNLRGNAGTNAATNFLGTSDNQPLNIRTNNIRRMTIDADGLIRVKSSGVIDTVVMDNIAVAQANTRRYFSNTLGGSSHNSFGYLGNNFSIQDDASTSGTFQRLVGLSTGSTKNGSSNNSLGVIGIQSSATLAATASGTTIMVNGNYSIATDRSSSSGLSFISAVNGLMQFHGGNSGTVTAIGINSLIQFSTSTASPMTRTFTELSAFTGGGLLTSTASSTITATDLSGVKAGFTTNSGVSGFTITNYQNFWASGLTGTGTANITNMYGLRVDDVTRGTNNWAIRTGLGLNSFGDNIEQRGTGYFKLATGTTAQRPATATAGMTRFNSTTGSMEYYDGTVWSSVSNSNIYTADGTLAGNRTVTQGANTLAFTSTATNGFSVDGSTFSIDGSNNRVGIGTTAPVASLHIVGDHASQMRIGSTGNAGRINFARGSDGGPNGIVGFNGASESADFTVQSLSGSGFITFYTNTAGTVSEKVRITNNGSVGIGTTTPRAQLDVVGTGAIIVPSGTTAQQPSTPEFGMIRYNSTIGRGEMYVNDLNGDGTTGDAGWRAL